jgi:hypothetical protein
MGCKSTKTISLQSSKKFKMSFKNMSFREALKNENSKELMMERKSFNMNYFMFNSQ